jgi:hypothetical protein
MESLIEQKFGAVSVSFEHPDVIGIVPRGGHGRDRGKASYRVWERLEGEKATMLWDRPERGKVEAPLWLGGGLGSWARSTQRRTMKGKYMRHVVSKG